MTAVAVTTIEQIQRETLRSITFWCAFHEQLCSAEHFFRCEILRPPPPEIHYHPVRRECVKAAWAREATIHRREAVKEHPEQREGEIYIGNVDMEAFRQSDWRTKRLGRTAYDADGNAIPADDAWFGRSYPMFVHARTIREAIAFEENSDNPNRQERIAVYRSMLERAL